MSAVPAHPASPEPAPGSSPVVVSRRLRLLVTTGLLLLLIAHTLAVDMARMAEHARLYKPHRESRLATQMEAAHTLLDTGRLYSIQPARRIALLKRSEQEPTEGAPLDVGPWLGPAAEGPVVLVKDISASGVFGLADDFGTSVVIAATWALVGVRSVVTAQWWILPFQVANLLCCFLLVRRLSNTVCGLVAAALVAQLEPLVVAAVRWWIFSMPVYAGVAVATALVYTRGRRPLWFGLSLGVGLALADQFRAVVGMLWLAVTLGMWLRFGWRKSALATLGCVSALVVFGGLVTSYQARYATTPNAGHHPRWHTMVVGLGEFPNPYGYEYDDWVTADLVRAVAPDAPHLSPEYERGARQVFFEAVTAHPRWYAGVLAKRLRRVLVPDPGEVRWASTLPTLRWRAPPGVMRWGVLALGWLVIGHAVVRWDRVTLAALGTFGYFVAVPTLSHTHGQMYYMAATAGLCLMAPVGAWHVTRGVMWLGRRAGEVLPGPLQSASWFPIAAQGAQRVERRLRSAIPLVLAVAATRALWTGAQLLWTALPWSAAEGYAAAFAGAPGPPVGTDLMSLPQPYVEPPLLLWLLRGLIGLSGQPALRLSRLIGVAGALALAAAAGWFARRATRSWAVTLAAVCAVLAVPASPAIDGTQPALVGAGAACLWATACMLKRTGPAAIWSAALWGLAVLLEPGALVWGLVLVCAAIWQGYPWHGLGTLLGGAAVVGTGLWALAEPGDLARWHTVWSMRPLPPLLPWMAWSVVLGAATLPALAGAVAWFAGGRGLTTESRVVALAVFSSGLSLVFSHALALSAAVALLVSWCVVQWHQSAGRSTAVGLVTTILLLTFGLNSAVVRPPAPSPPDRESLTRLSAAVAAIDGPVLIEGWYGLAAHAGRPPWVHAHSLPWLLQRSTQPGFSPLVQAIEAQRFARVVYTGDQFGSVHVLRRALLSHYEPESMFVVQSAEGPTVLTLMRPR